MSSEEKRMIGKAAGSLIYNFAAGIFGGACAWFFLYATMANAAPSATTSAVLKTHELRIVDDQGRTRADIFCDKTGKSIIGIEDGTGKMSVMISEGMLGIEGSASSIRMLVGSSCSAEFIKPGVGEAYVGVSDLGSLVGASSKRGVANVKSSPTGIPSITIQNGSAKIDSVVDNEDGPSETLSDFDGVNRAVLGVCKTESRTTGEKITTAASCLTLFGKDHKLTWQTP